MQTTIILKEFFDKKSIEWNLHVDSTPGLHRYDMILGCDIMSELRITLNFKDQMMTWDDSTIIAYERPRVTSGLIRSSK